MKVVTAVVNNPLFIELQYHSLKKYMPCDYEFIVFNDAKDFPDFTNGGDITIRKQIEDICTKLKIKCMNVSNEHHALHKVASYRTGDTMNIIMRYQLKYPDEYLLLDSDMFLVDTFDIEKYRKYDCSIVLRHILYEDQSVYHLWNGIYYFNIYKKID